SATPASDERRRRSGLKYGEPHALTDYGLVVEQVGETNALEHVIDLALQKKPYRPDAARLGFGAALVIHRMRHAVQIEGCKLGGVDHPAHRDRCRFPREQVPASGAAHAGDDVGP